VAHVSITDIVHTKATEQWRFDTWTRNVSTRVRLLAWLVASSSLRSSLRSLRPKSSLQACAPCRLPPHPRRLGEVAGALCPPPPLPSVRWTSLSAGGGGGHGHPAHAAERPPLPRGCFESEKPEKQAQRPLSREANFMIISGESQTKPAIFSRAARAKPALISRASHQKTAQPPRKRAAHFLNCSRTFRPQRPFPPG